MRTPKKRRFLALLLTAAMVLGLCPAMPVAADPAPASQEEASQGYQLEEGVQLLSESGSCGDNITWTLDDDGTLTVTGTGDIPGQFEGRIRDKTKRLVVGPGITSLPYGLMSDSDNLVSVTLPEGLEAINPDAFNSCDNLTDINIPSTVVWIGSTAFTSCGKLEQISLPEGLEYLGRAALHGCASIKEITIPAGLTQIYDNTFCSCDALEEIVIPRGVRSIGEMAFAYCKSLKRVVIPDTVQTIGKDAFMNCASLPEVTLPATLLSLDKNAFYGCRSLLKIIYMASQEQWDLLGGLDMSHIGPVGQSNLVEVEFRGEGALTTQVTFDANGGTVDTPTKDVIYGTEYGDLPVPVNGDLPFYGWFTQPEGGTTVDKFTQMNSLENHTLYAHWGITSTGLTPAAGKKPTVAWPVVPNVYYGSNGVTTEMHNEDSHSVEAYLYANEKGGLTRVERGYIREENVPIYQSKSQVIVNELDADYNLQAQLLIPFELPLWGGFYEGKNFNFLIYGQRNKEEDNDKEVLRVVKYDKNWNRLGSGSVYGANTTVPFDAGSLHCAEDGDFLVVHTSHEMYKSGDGLNHQSNMTFIFRQSDMTLSYNGAGMVRKGYVSHSFYQNVLVDEDKRLFTLDKGDGYPRALVIHCFEDVDFDRGIMSSKVNEYNLQEFPGESGDNSTGCNAGGMAETTDGYMVAYRYNPDSLTELAAGNVYVHFVNKDTFNGKSVQLTTGGSVGNPMVVPVGLDGGYIIWPGMEDKYYSNGTLYYARYHADGRVGEIQQGEGYISDCQPALYNGKLIWYATTAADDDQNKQTMNFYSLDITTNELTNTPIPLYDEEPIETPEPTPGTDPTPIPDPTPEPGDTPTPSPSPTPEPISFVDVKPNDWFAKQVAWAVSAGITSGKGSTTTFKPNDTCTRAEIMTFIWASEGRPSASSAATFSDMPSLETFRNAISWAVEKGITNGVGSNKFGSTSPCTRVQAMTFLWVAAGSPKPSREADFSDMPSNPVFRDAISWAVENKVTNGVGNNQFGPNHPCTRGQIVTFLYAARNAD